ncbi:MAG: glucosaminidase domain-containing protein [bacterium]
MKFNKYIFIIIITLCGFSCKSKKRIITKKSTKKVEVVTIPEKKVDVVSPKDQVEVQTNQEMGAIRVPTTTEDYILLYKNTAITEMQLYKIPASITLAQGILESGSGKGRLAVKANNHFGIKCHGWEGEKIYHDDDKRQECFRSYSHPKSSFRDHSEFLSKRGRYAKLFKLKLTDYKGWARELRRAGYATDRKYPEKLIHLIERYQLYKYDSKVPKESKADSFYKVTHLVNKGETLYSISKKYNTTVEEIKGLNNLKTNDLSIGQELIIKIK